jgi:hypothetical protein
MTELLCDFQLYVMKRGNWLTRFVIPLLVVGSVSCTYYENEIYVPPVEGPEEELSYIGSEQCALCHEEKYETFIKSGHPYKLPKVENGVAPTYPFTTLEYLPPYFQNDWNNVSYVIGGFAWKYRFIDKNGYIYTGDDAQYNYLDESIVGYHADEDPGTKIYDCGRCHTTGWKSVDEGGKPQDGLPGMAGEFFAGGIHCEQCHGMGSDHAKSRSPEDISINREAVECGKCHYRNEDHTIAASGGFIKHHEQYDEMISAGHADVSCNDCHDPHVTVKHGQTGGIIKECTECHTDMKNPTHRSADCNTCHLPFATKSGAMLNKYVGDVQTHIFKINPAADGEMFNEDGTLANGETGVTLSYVCYQCHKDTDGIGGDKSTKTLEQLSAKATGYHN